MNLFTMTRRGQARSRGFVLMELLVVVVLLAAFMIVSTQLFVLATRAHRDSIRRTEQIGRVDAAVRRFRADVWGASAASVTPDGDLHLSGADGETVWRAAPLPPPVMRGAEFGLERAAGARQADRASWKGLPAATFSVAGPVVMLTFHAAAGEESAAAVSDVMLHAGSRP
ncbi:MAG TPA: hypothetical protein VHQ47_08355 [Phycisphaerae bacterium]|nr:hypothetical protein [Phycisphaerae bacterium]